MNGNPRNAAFKKRVAIEALKGERSVNEIAKEYGVHHTLPAGSTC